MKRKLLTIILTIFCVNSQAQNVKTKNENNTVNIIEDKIALKELVDKFSILADTKEVSKQVLLFTENAIVESFINGKSTGVLEGRKQIGDAFLNFLNLFEIVYHLNGQQSVEINENNAKGISYCLVTLIGTENGKKIKTTFGIYYNDEFIKIENKWFITKRKSTFSWQEKQELKN